MRSEEVCRELRHLYEEQQLGVAAIARQLNISPATVSNRLRRCGVAMRSGRFTARPIDPEILRQLYLEEQLTLRAIAAHLGVSIGTVNNHRRRLGLPGRRRQ